jgi:hypothetical protein
MTALASAAADNAVSGRLESYLGKMDMDQISDAMTPGWFPMLYTFVDVWHYATGLGLICLFLKIGFGFTLRVIGIYNRQGWGWWFCVAITDITFMIFRLFSLKIYNFLEIIIKSLKS